MFNNNEEILSKEHLSMHTLLPVSGALSESYEQDILTGILISRSDAAFTVQFL